jgi:hypothetical protein
MFHIVGKKMFSCSRFTRSFVWLAVMSAMSFLQTSAFALTVPFTENFTSDSANWYNATGVSPLGWQSSGGPDGSGYASGIFNFVNSGANDTPALLRAQDEFNSSGNAFVGNWNAAGVTTFTAYVRHDAGIPLSYFVRFATPANFPGAAGVVSTPVQSGVWTQITIPISPGTLIVEGPPSFYNSVFTNMGHVQIGVDITESMAGVDQIITFDVDQAQIVPEPAAMGLMLVSGLALLRSRRRKTEVL